MDRYLALIGRGIKRSRSPCIHKLFMRLYDIKGDYRLLDIGKQEIPETLAKLRQGEIFGLNITIPYKTEVRKWCEEYSEEVAATGAVNTMRVSEGKLTCFLTDVHGFMRSVPSRLQKNKKGKALILGAGGAARAVIHALMLMGWDEVFVTSRTPRRIEELGELFPWVRAYVQEFTGNFDMVVNATPVISKALLKLMGKGPSELIKEDGIYFDLNYFITWGCRSAQDAGLHYLCGDRMLIHQAAEAFRVWFGVNPLDKIDVESVMKECLDAQD